MNSNVYKVGIYIRLSREDDDKLEMSESIKNQRSLLLQYVKENHFQLIDTYIDDGFSGTNFDRPGFKRLIKDIENKKINMVITKDMSRLGRDYIETGRYIEKYFPEHNIRYIAITDNVDTFLDSANNDIAPFKAIMNDMYAKDISKKIKSSIRAKQKEGKWVSGRCPFGYDIDKNDRNKLVINWEQADVVKSIFSMALDGMSSYKIATKLTEEKIKTPAQYYSFEWKNHYKLNYGIWNAKTVKDILTNRIYIGDTVQNKRSKVNYKIKKIVKNNPSDYIIVENTHDAIIERDIFEEVQMRIPKNAGRCEKKEHHLLDGLLYCMNCGHRISVTSRRKKDNKCYTICNYYRTYQKHHVCTTHSNNYDVLEKVIIDRLRILCLEKFSKEIIQKSISWKNDNEDISVSIRKMQSDLDKDICHLDDIYIDKLNKQIDSAQYKRIKMRLEGDIAIKRQKIAELREQLLCINNDDIYQESVQNYIQEFLSLKKFSRELVVNLIEKIEIGENKDINIKVNFLKT